MRTIVCGARMWKTVLEVSNGPSSGGTTALVITSHVFLPCKCAVPCCTTKKVHKRPHPDTVSTSLSSSEGVEAKQR